MKPNIIAFCLGLALCLLTSARPAPTASATAPSMTGQTMVAPATNANMVVVTRKGKKYHRPSCGCVKKKAGTRTMTWEEALRQGYGPCQKCKPPYQ